MPEWDVYRDKDGKPVTLTWEQVKAVWHAWHIWMQVVYKEHPEWPDYCNNPINMEKSCLLGRMLIDGRPPLPEAPPLVMAAPAYHLVDPDLCPTCGLVRDGKPGLLASTMRLPSELAKQLIQPVSKTYTLVFCGEDWQAPHRDQV